MNEDQSLENLFQNQANQSKIEPRQELWERIESKLENQNNKRKLTLYKYVSAASILLIVAASASFLYFNSINQSSNFNEVVSESESMEEYWRKESERILNQPNESVAVQMNENSATEEIEFEVQDEETKENSAYQSNQSSTQKNADIPNPEEYEVEGISAAPLVKTRIKAELDEIPVVEEDAEELMIEEVSAERNLGRIAQPSSIKRKKEENVELKSNLNSQDSISYNDFDGTLSDEVIETAELSKVKLADTNFQFYKKKLKFANPKVTYRLQKEESPVIIYTTSNTKFPEKIVFNLANESYSVSAKETAESINLKRFLEQNKDSIFTELVNQF